MLPKYHSNRKWFTGLHRFLIVHSSVFAGRNIKADLVSILKHDAIAADVFDASLGIASNHEMRRSQIAPAVALVPSRHRKFEQINLVTAFNILHYSASGDDIWFDRFKRSKLCTQSIN